MQRNIACRIKARTYHSLLTGTVGYIHPGAALFKLGQEPDVISFHNVLRTSRIFFTGVNKIDLGWLEQQSPGMHARLKEHIDRVAVTEVRIGNVPQGILRTILGKFNMNEELLAKELGCHVQADYDNEALIAWCPRADAGLVTENLQAKVAATRHALEQEVVEELLVGTTRVVWGAGAQVHGLLFDNDFISINLRNVPTDWSAAQLRKLCERFGELRECSLLPAHEGKKEKVQWGHVVYASAEDARKSLRELQGEVYEGHSLAVSLGGIRQPSVFHDVAGSLILSFATAPSAQSAHLIFERPDYANEVLNSHVFPKMYALGTKPNDQATVSTGEAKGPRPSLDGSGRFRPFDQQPSLKPKSNIRFTVSLKNLAANVDELEIAKIIYQRGLPQPVYISVKRDPTKVTTKDTPQPEGSLSEDLVDIHNYIPFDSKVVSRTTFTDDKRRRRGINIFYQSVDAVVLSLTEARATPPPTPRFGQPVRLEAQFNCDLAIHSSLWDLHKVSFTAILDKACRSGVTLSPRHKGATRVMLHLQAADLDCLLMIKSEIEQTLKFLVFTHPLKHLLFSHLGRARLGRLSDAYIHWDNSTSIIRIYGTQEEQETARQSLVSLIDQLKDMLLDVQLIISRQHRRLMNKKEITRLQQKLGLEDLRLLGCRLFASGTAEQVEKLQTRLEPHLIKKGTSTSGECGLCFDDLDEPYALQVFSL